jgi:hypothetical protein
MRTIPAETGNGTPTLAVVVCTIEITIIYKQREPQYCLKKCQSSGIKFQHRASFFTGVVAFSRSNVENASSSRSFSSDDVVSSV